MSDSVEHLICEVRVNLVKLVSQKLTARPINLGQESSDELV